MRENRHPACMTRETMERVGGSRAVTCAYRKLPSGKMKSISIKSPQSSSPILAQHLRPRSNTAWMKPRLKTCKPLDPHLPSLRDRPLLSQRERRGRATLNPAPAMREGRGSRAKVGGGQGLGQTSPPHPPAQPCPAKPPARCKSFQARTCRRAGDEANPAQT